jgi:hypothetical protein
MNRLSLRNNIWKLETSRELSIILEEYVEYIRMKQAKPEDVNVTGWIWNHWDLDQLYIHAQKLLG